MNCKIALVFLVVLAVVLKSSQGKSIHDIKDDIDDFKKPLIAAKVGIAKTIGGKIKLAALKKAAAVKAVAIAPFVLGKKLALLKIGAVKSLVAFKAAKAKKVFDFAADKTAPAVAGVSLAAAAVAGIPAAAAAAVTGIPAAAVAALIPNAKPQSQVTQHTEVLDIYTYPGNEQHYQAVHSIPSNTHYSSYEGVLDAPRTYSNDYSLVTGSETGSQYYPITDIIQPHNTYGVPSN